MASGFGRNSGFSSGSSMAVQPVDGSQNGSDQPERVIPNQTATPSAMTATLSQRLEPSPAMRRRLR